MQIEAEKKGSASQRDDAAGPKGEGGQAASLLVSSGLLI